MLFGGRISRFNLLVRTLEKFDEQDEALSNKCPMLNVYICIQICAVVTFCTFRSLQYISNENHLSVLLEQNVGVGDNNLVLTTKIPATVKVS
jgi:hypothetical protein